MMSIDKNTPVEAIEFVSFDVETTGLNPNVDQIIEIGAVRFTLEEELDRFHSLVKPSVPINEVAVQIHSITPDMLVNAPRIEALFPSFIAFIENAVLVAHNISFDLSFMNVALQREGHPALSNTALDTVKLAKRALPNQRSYKLENLATSIGVVDTFHRALSDANSCRELFLHCVEQISFIGQASLGDLF